MKKFPRILPSLILLPITIFSVITLLPSEDVPAASETLCREQLFIALQDEFDGYRRVVFGSTGAALTNSGGTVLKTGGTMFKGDLAGIFETKNRLTSELIEPLTESYRTLRCRSLSVCETLERSIGAGGSANNVTVQTLGCEPIERPLFSECGLADGSPQANIAELVSFCRTAVTEGLEYERTALKTAVAYDSSYRSLLQFTGMFDAFLKEAPVSTFTALRQMAGLLGKLHQIPCFSGHCDLPSPLPQ